jgi:hypothetical protein
MSWTVSLFKTKARRKAEQDKRRLAAVTRAKTALRRERRAIGKRQGKADELRREAVSHEREGREQLARQAVRQFVQIDKECTARALALNNMEYTLEQVQVKTNYDDFVRGMQVVADIEELAQQTVDPDEVRERLTDLSQRNQDLVEPWMDVTGADFDPAHAKVQLSGEEEEAYRRVVSDAVGELAHAGSGEANDTFAQMDAELERKMDAALNRE